MNPGRRALLSTLLGVPDAPVEEVSADQGGLGRRDLLSIFMWIILAFVGRWKIPAQLAPAAELVHRKIFKGGTIKISFLIKGWELPPSMTMLVDAETREKVFGDEQFREEFVRSLQVGFKRGEEVSDAPFAAG